MKKLIITLMMSIFSFLFVFDIAKAESTSMAITQAKDFSKTSKNRKEVFVQTLLPMINTVKEEIESDKKVVQDILLKNSKELTAEETAFLETNYKKYNVKTQTPEELLKKMVVPPASLILAQASVESGWGRSQLAVQANNLFGMTSLSKSDTNSVKMGKVRYKKYDTIFDSVEDYILTIARHYAYKNLRGGIRRGEDSVALVKHLGSYSELGKQYGNYVAKVIKSNSFQQHDEES